MQLTPLPELNRVAFRILARELGVPDTLRFFGQFSTGSGDYTVQRRTLFEGLTIEEYRKALADLEGAPETPGASVPRDGTDHL